MSDDLYVQLPLSSYPERHHVTTRWSDNDMYGHMNNAVYYQMFDAAINTWISKHLNGTFEQQQIIGVVAESGCRFWSSVAFPGSVTIGVRITRLGRSSVTYGLGVFEGERPEESQLARASAHWVHVYVDRHTGNTTPVPSALRDAMSELVVGGP